MKMKRILIAVVLIALVPTISIPTFAQNSTHTIWTDPETGYVYDIPRVGEYCLDFDEDWICDIDFLNGKLIVYPEEDEEAGSVEDEESGSDLPYCDQASSSEACFDRQDYDQNTGLYPCKDGSYEEDWRDCDGNGGGNDDDDDVEEDSSDLDDDSDDDGNNCQSQDDFCDDDEGCESESVYCIDDRGFDEDDYNG
jgi:hypothetical protein